MRVRLTFCKSSTIINLINNIRFQGDNYHYGLTVKGFDKTATKEVLEVYIAFKGAGLCQGDSGSETTQNGNLTGTGETSKNRKQ